MSKVRLNVRFMLVNNSAVTSKPVTTQDTQLTTTQCWLLSIFHKPWDQWWK